MLDMALPAQQLRAEGAAERRQDPANNKKSEQSLGDTRRRTERAYRLLRVDPASARFQLLHKRSCDRWIRQRDDDDGEQNHNQQEREQPGDPSHARAAERRQSLARAAAVEIDGEEPGCEHPEDRQEKQRAGQRGDAKRE